MSTLFNIGNKIVSSDTELKPLILQPLLYFKEPQGDEEIGGDGVLNTFNPENGFNFTVRRPTGANSGKKYVLGKDGFIVEVPSNTPAVEYNPDGSYKGVLVEPAGTNDCLYSEDFSTEWGGNLQAVQSTKTTPDGDSTNKYIKLVVGGGGGIGSATRSQTVTITTGVEITFSVFLKPTNTIKHVRIGGINIDGPVNARTYFELSGSGIIGTEGANVNSSSIEEYPNGWYRCSVTWTQGELDDTVITSIRLASENGNDDVPFDGTSSIFAWGAQVETGPIATSYIPTTTGAVTRVKDDIYLTSASSLIGQKDTGGTLFAEVDWRGVPGTTQNILSIHNGNYQNNIFIYNRSTSALRMRGFAGVNNELTDSGESSSSYSGIQKIAFAYADNDFELYRNGASIASDTNGSLASLETLTNVNFGSNDAGGGAIEQANMWIRSVALYDKRLTDTQLQQLTSL